MADYLDDEDELDGATAAGSPKLTALELLASGPAPQQEDENPEAYNEALTNTRIRNLAGGLGRAADIIYQGYTGEKSPVAGLQEKKMAAENDPMQAYEKDRLARQQYIKAALQAKMKYDLGKASAADNEAARALKEKMGGASLAEQKRHNMAMEKATAAKGKDDLRQLPASEASDIGGIDAAMALADDLYKNYQSLASGQGAGIKQHIVGTDANLYKSLKGSYDQAIGKLAEGGKLTDQDLKFFQKNAPSPTDTNEQAKVKFEAIKNRFGIAKSSKIDALKRAKFDVTGFEAPAAAKPLPSSEDLKALEWANKNPNDPRAKAIIESLK